MGDPLKSKVLVITDLSDYIPLIVLAHEHKTNQLGHKRLAGIISTDNTSMEKAQCIRRMMRYMDANDVPVAFDSAGDGQDTNPYIFDKVPLELLCDEEEVESSESFTEKLLRQTAQSETKVNVLCLAGLPHFWAIIRKNEHVFLEAVGEIHIKIYCSFNQEGNLVKGSSLENEFYAFIQKHNINCTVYTRGVAVNSPFRTSSIPKTMRSKIPVISKLIWNKVPEHQTTDKKYTEMYSYHALVALGCLHQLRNRLDHSFITESPLVLKEGCKQYEHDSETFDGPSAGKSIEGILKAELGGGGAVLLGHIFEKLHGGLRGSR
ncbi:hypothetical protein BDV96DRAFT_653024 [Lophiotrema nucula]|uniref:Inosine/uridine-preferring nucleoside hydrolase domain-containing protein n=1 Tax=Lophiotrema nucula TaxID=690887 RepID=A0A6A5YPJ9_9PLEO|nr:hypothetical protein BDV96DRAFT_653024 [Lophiotrema nucula]